MVVSIQGNMQINWKIFALAIVLLIVTTGAIVIFQDQIQSSFNPPINPSPTPSPTETPRQFVVTTVTASPSNTTPGLVIVVAEVKNQGTQNQTVLVEMQIQEPNGNIMSIPNNSSTTEITADRSNTTTFSPVIPLNVKIGKFNVDIDVYDLNHTIQYYSTGFIYSFSTPIHFFVGFSVEPDITNYEFTVDGTTYYEQALPFYWYLGTNHTISVPEIITNAGYPFFSPDTGWRFSSWEYIASNYITSKGNTVYVNVTADTPTYRILADYVRYP
jgi:hypothetical protein